METSTASTVISDHIIKALCNTLMHSLWQGVLLAVAAGIIIVFTKKSSAAYRYNLLIAAMVLFTCGTVFTFLWQLHVPQSTTGNYIGYPTAENTTVSSAVDHIPAAGTPAIQQNAKVSIAETVVNYFNMHDNAIVLIWFLIICAKSVQMAVGLHNVFNLKRTKVSAVSKYWEGRFLQLAAQMKIKQAIGLLESGIAKVPMAIGHLKPVILLPIGLVNSLSAEEVEAILVHELAHIRRRDYLVNLLQSFLEIVFFFNPALLWISQLIKTERENCCDDLALQQSSDTVIYIRALVSCQEYKSVIPAHVMAFPGSKNTLLDRVKRMAGNRNHSLNMFEKTVLTICMVVLGLGISAFTAREDIKKVMSKVVAVIQRKVNAGDKEKVKAVKNDNNIKKQATSINSTAAILNQIWRPALPARDTGKEADLSRLKILTHNMDSLRGNDAVSKSPLAALAKLDTANFKKSREIGRELYREHLITDTDHLNITTYLDKRELIVNGVLMPDDVYQRIYEKFYKKGGNDGSYGINYENGNNYSADKENSGNYGISYSNKYIPPGAPVPPLVIVPDFGDTLVKYGVIKDKRHIHAVFNDHELVINGVKQQDDVFEMLLKKYVTKPGDKVNITYTNNGLPDKRMEQNAYWAVQQKKIIDQMQLEGLTNNKNNVSFVLTDRQFMINGLVQSDEVFQRYRREYVPADANDNWTWNYRVSGNYPTSAYRSGDWEGYNRQMAAERQRLETERDKKLVADLLQDGLITDPNNVTFTLNDKTVTINGEKQSDSVHKKYKEKYMPATAGGGWNWTYQHHK